MERQYWRAWTLEPAAGAAAPAGAGAAAELEEALSQQFDQAVDNIVGDDDGATGMPHDGWIQRSGAPAAAAPQPAPAPLPVRKLLQLHPSIFLPFGPTAAERGKPTDAFRCRLPRQPVAKVWAGGSPQFEMRDDERTELNRATVVSLASVEAAGGAGAIARINLLLAMGGRCVCTLTPPACFLPHTRALHASPAEARCLPHTRSLSANPAELC